MNMSKSEGEIVIRIIEPIKQLILFFLMKLAQRVSNSNQMYMCTCCTEDDPLS